MCGLVHSDKCKFCFRSIVEERETWKFWFAVNKDAYQYELLHVSRAFRVLLLMVVLARKTLYMFSIRDLECCLFGFLQIRVSSK